MEYTKKLFYGKSIEIEITPNYEVYYNFSFNDIPSVINICYSDITDIIDLFNTPEGGILIQKVYANEIVLNIFPSNNVFISEYEKNYLIGHESLFKRHNVKFYNFDDIETNIIKIDESKL